MGRVLSCQQCKQNSPLSWNISATLSLHWLQTVTVSKSEAIERDDVQYAILKRWYPTYHSFKIDSIKINHYLFSAFRYLLLLASYYYLNFMIITFSTTACFICKDISTTYLTNLDKVCKFFDSFSPLSGSKCNI